jgi:signal transduction histidine kinase
MGEPYGWLTLVGRSAHTIGDMTTVGQLDEALRHAQLELDEDVPIELRNPLRPMLLAGTLTLFAFSSGVAAVPALAARFDVDIDTRIWLLFSGAFCLSWLVLMVVRAIRTPTVEETVGIWGSVARYIVIGSTAVLLTLIWGYFPAFPFELQVMIGGMICACPPCHVMATPESVLVNRVTAIATYGSLAIWFAMSQAPGALSFAAFPAFVGVFVVVMGGYANRSVLATVQAQIASDRHARELAKALDEVAEERDAKTRFIAAASHDLGQPLQAASLYFDQSLRAPEGDLRARAVDGVKQAFASAEQLLAHMLNHLRLEADAVDPQFAPIPVGKLLAGIALQHAPAAEQVGMRIGYVSSSLIIQSDRVLLERALGNLINNAIMHSGGTRLLIGLRRKGKHDAELWVIDNGAGILPEEQDGLFTDYFRGRASEVARRSGFGLGLASVRRISRLLGGEARLDPRWRKGAAFCIELAPNVIVAPKRGKRS